MITHFWAMWSNHYSTPTTPLFPAAMPPIAKNSPIIPELFSMLNEHKTVPIILKLCQHNWEKPNNEPKRLVYYNIIVAGNMFYCMQLTLQNHWFNGVIRWDG